MVVILAFAPNTTTDASFPKGSNVIADAKSVPTPNSWASGHGVSGQLDGVTRHDRIGSIVRVRASRKLTPAEISAGGGRRGALSANC
jgi:hypothetical protein